MSAKPQIHISAIIMMEKCGERFRRRYGADFGWNDRNEIIPPGIALITGIATHKSIEQNLGNKIQTGELLPLEQIKDIARDSMTGLWQQEVRLLDEEAQNLKQAKGESIDMVVSLSELHATELAPKLRPKSVERKWVIELNGYPYDLAGKIDIEETDHTIRDTKTSKKSPAQGEADSSEQLTMYYTAKKICDKVIPPKLYLDNLVKTSKLKVITLETQRTDQDVTMLLRRIERAIQVIEKGAFTPARADWWGCSARFCGFHNSCPFWSGK